MSDGLRRLLEKHGIPMPEYSSVGDGWLPLIDELITKLKALGWDCKLSCIKEKFGGLRFCTESFTIGKTAFEMVPVIQSELTDEMGKLIGEAEEKSLTICEECGAPGGPVSGAGWAMTRCDAHNPVSGWMRRVLWRIRRRLALWRYKVRWRLGAMRTDERRAS